MITMITAERRAILGKLRTASCPPLDSIASGLGMGRTACHPQSQISRENVAVEMTAIGKILERTWLEIPKKFPGIRVFEYQVMPDHFHGIIFFETPQNKPLGAVVGFLKAHTTSLCKQAGLLSCSGAGIFAGEAATRAQSLERCLPSCSGAGGLPSALWSKGYCDSILLHKGQLNAMREYIKDNPRRLAIKRANRGLFKVVSCLPFGDGAFMALGNRFLLEAPFFYQIQCSRSITSCEFEQKKNDCYNAIKRGAVIVSPCISPGEREIAKEVFEAKGKLIVLKNKGFAPFYKPAGAMFDACAEGRILLLSPSAWGYLPGKKSLTRLDACVMNRLAQLICKEDAATIDYKGMTPTDIESLVRAALTSK